MPIPLAVAAPAAAAGLAYLNARSALWYDGFMLSCVLPATASMYWRAHTGRLSLFYDLEQKAASKTTAGLPFLLFEDRAYTYAAAYDMVLRYGHWLRTRFGIRKGEVVAMDFPNSDVYIFVWMGLWAIGARPAFINYNLSGHALVHCVKAAGSALMLVDEAVAHSVDDAVRRELASVSFHVFTAADRVEVSGAEPVRHPDELRDDDALNNMAILIYTSGTTGLPKAAVVSWGKLHAAGGFSARLIGTKPGEVYYTCMPLYHSAAAIMGFGNALLLGATFALGARFSTRTFWRDVRRHNATQIQYVGETCRYLLAAPPDVDPATGEDLDRKHRVRVAFGNGLRPDVWNRFKERFGIAVVAEFYGATEGSFGTWNVSANDFAMGAVGRSGWLYTLLLGRTVSIIEVDLETDQPRRDPRTGLCRQARTGEPGELLFRLPDDVDKRFQGYYGDTKASGEKVLRGVFRRGDAWFRTGDVMRKDREGRLYFNDRIGDTFRWKGENVSTAEVGQAVGLHPAVREANVYGVQLPCHDGRAGCAAVVLAEDEPGEELLRGLAEHVRKQLPRYAVPIFLRVVRGGMQTTGTNKHQKHGLRQQGVDPRRVEGDLLYWLKDGTYARFREREWDELSGGRVKL